MEAEINYVVLYSANIERLKNFYERLFSVKFDEHLDHKPKHYGTNFGQVYLVIYASAYDNKNVDRIGFSVTSLDKMMENIEQRYFHTGPKPSKYGRFAIIKDPDDRLIHIFEKSK